MGYVSFEKPFKIVDSAGNVIYEGAGKFASLIEAQTHTTDTNGIESYTGTIVDGPNTVIAGPYTPSGAEYVERLVVARVAAAASVGFIGVSVNKFGILGGSKGVVAGAGSVLAVRVTSGAIAVGQIITGSATAGLCAADATPAIGEMLGMCIKAAAQEGTSGNYFAGVLVSPGNMS